MENLKGFAYPTTPICDEIAIFALAANDKSVAAISFPIFFFFFLYSLSQNTGVIYLNISVCQIGVWEYLAKQVNSSGHK